MSASNPSSPTVRDTDSSGSKGRPAPPGADPAGESTAETPATGVSRALVLLFAVACGTSVANLYYAQPILHTIAGHFGTSSGTAGLIVTLSQIGYAAGLAFLVPLGDLLKRRRLIPLVLVATTIGLAASAASPNMGVLVAMALIVGAGSVVAQMLIPMAATLADDEHRGQVVGTVMGGLLLGILLARTVSGLVAGVSSWRVVYLLAAVLMVLMAVVLARRLPPEGARPRLSYAALLASTAALLVHESLLRRRAIFGALSFAAFSIFWTTIAFLLAGAPFYYGDTVIGLFAWLERAGPCAPTSPGVGRTGSSPGSRRSGSPQRWPCRSCQSGSAATTWAC